MQYTRENIIDGILTKIDSMHTISERQKNRLKKELVNYPIEIEQNILEWVNDLPITEVDCHGESIKHVMKIFDLTEEDVPYLIKNFINFKDSGFRVYTACYGVFGECMDQKN